VDLAGLIQAAGADSVCIVDPKQAKTTQAAFEAGLASEGLAVVIVERACPLWAGETTP
jgi:TPP-dependent indolepyruvate ferredoxin oxidoreductase alpha subunit